tara:strand:- start:8308 stop:8847 length:540 start_codon:yes stop_codon:yes gene_type:complete
MVSDAKIECPNCKSIVRKDGFSKHKKSKKCIKATNSKKVEVVEKKEIKPKVVEEVVVVEPKLEEEIEMDSIVKTGDGIYQITLNLTNTHITIFFKKNKETTELETTELELQLYNVIFNSNNYKLRKALTHNALNEEPLLTEKIEIENDRCSGCGRNDDFCRCGDFNSFNSNPLNTNWNN